MAKIKNLFNSQYYGQFLGCDVDGGTPEPRYLMIGTHLELGVEWLQLKTVNQLTDDELLLIEKVQDWRRGWNTDNSRVDHSTIQLLNYFVKGELGMNFELYRVLISLGVAVPFFFLDDNKEPVIYSVEKLIELGWIKIKE